MFYFRNFTKRILKNELKTLLFITILFIIFFVPIVNIWISSNYFRPDYFRSYFEFYDRLIGNDTLQNVLVLWLSIVVISYLLAKIFKFFLFITSKYFGQIPKKLIVYLFIVLLLSVDTYLLFFHSWYKVPDFSRGMGFPFGQSRSYPSIILSEYSQTSNYGYEKENPIKVGGGPFGEVEYLNSLYGPNGESIFYERMGSMGYSNGIVDIYRITYDGKRLPIYLYLDMYKCETPKVPKNFTARHDSNNTKFMTDIVK